MGTSWTNAQTTAINTRNKTLLISAAAGSGKTLTLTERIIRSITSESEKADISQMLIVTFTKASANDLKAKIFRAVSEALANDPKNPHLNSQLAKLGNAKISTIDAFYLSAVKANFSRLGISSSFRIADNAEASLLAMSVMKDTVELFYSTEESFSSLCECFETIKDTEGVIEPILIELYNKCLNVPKGIEYVRHCAEKCAAYDGSDFLKTSFGGVLKTHTVSFFEGYLEAYEKILADISVDEKVCAAYYDALHDDKIFCIRMLNALNGKSDEASYNDVAKMLSEYAQTALKRLSSSNATNDSLFCKDLRAAFKKGISTLFSEYFEYSEKDFARFFSATAKNLFVLHSVLREFEKNYMEEKKKRNILELSDVKRYAQDLFADKNGDPTDIAKEYANQFKYIYIDEYQDVDPVQDLIFRCISTPTNRFMVGDIKQSIYSFRGAEPSLFSSYRQSFPQHGTPVANSSTSESIFMSDNFRCSKPVIDFTNKVCSRLFSACKESIGYSQEDDLVFHKDGGSLVPVNLAIFAKNKKGFGEELPPEQIQYSCKEAEAMYVATEIKRLLNEKTENNEKDGEESDTKKVSNKYTASDIAILYRKNSSAKYIVDALKAVGLDCNVTESTQYFQNPDVLMTLCILNAVDNPQRDVYLAGAMRSPIYGFTLEELLLISSCAEKQCSLYDKVCICAEQDSELGKKCLEFLNALTRLRSMSCSLPVDKFLKYLFATDAFVASGLVCDKNASGEGGNLRQLYEYARNFEAGSFRGLYNFIEFINNLIEEGQRVEMGSTASSQNSITLTTIHASKGLEYPVCFIMNAAGEIHSKREREAMLCFEYDVGIAMDLSDDTGFAHYSSPLLKLLKLYRHKKTTEEEMRVLYVGMTRAQDRLYITAHSSKSSMQTAIQSAQFSARLNSPFAVMSSPSYMEWVLSAAMLPQDKDEESCFELYKFSPDNYPEFDAPTGSDISLDDLHASPDSELLKKLNSDYSFVYPRSALRDIPAKLSVSSLSPDVLDSRDEARELFNNEKKTNIPSFFLPDLSKSSSAERGTATHLFLQFCDFAFTAQHGVEESIAMLTKKGFIPQNAAELIYTSELERFMRSELAGLILSSDRVIREQRFNMLLPASIFSKNKEQLEDIEGENVAVQGVIDLILIDSEGNIGLYDYKTDRLTREELLDPSLAKKRMDDTHGLQLSYYASAVEYLFGKAPSRIAVYSTHAAALYDIDQKPLSETKLTL